jgi:hypothetical protein
MSRQILAPLLLLLVAYYGVETITTFRVQRTHDGNPPIATQSHVSTDISRRVLSQDEKRKELMIWP